MKTIEFECGCEFPQDDNGRILFNPDVEEINLDCPLVWDLMAEGKTTGIFQLESRLGGSHSKLFQPTSIDQLAILIAIIRPGCLDNVIDDKTVTKHVIDRKNEEEEVSYYHSSLEEVLHDSYGMLIYQEQAMKIVQYLAGFNLSEADILRRAIGKKKAEDMANVKKQFLKKCQEVGKVNQEEARHIFSGVEKGQRYSFNKCLDFSTTVDTPNEIKTLDEIEIGDQVKTPNGYMSVLNKYDNGTQDLYEIELESGHNIKCTLEHKFLCSDNEKHPVWEILKDNLEIVTI